MLHGEINVTSFMVLHQVNSSSPIKSTWDTFCALQLWKQFLHLFCNVSPETVKIAVNVWSVFCCCHCFTIAITVRCCYNVVNFLPNSHKRHPIAHPLGPGMGYILWVQTMIYTLPQSLQWCMQYHVILDCVVTAFDCILCYIRPCYRGLFIWQHF